MLAESAIDSKALLASKFALGQHIDFSSTLSTEGFVCLNPQYGTPEHAMLRVIYSPSNALLDAKSYQQYIMSFHNVGVSIENACQRICKDLGELLHPTSLSIEMNFGPVSGYRNFVRAEWKAT